MSTLKRHTTIVRRAAAAKIEAKRRANYGTKARHEWWHTLPCTCQGLHPACSGGRSDPSHTRSKACTGDERTIIPQSRGCHDWIGSRGWREWDLDVGALLSGGNPSVSMTEDGLRLDRHALAAELATRGPDAPGAA